MNPIFPNKGINTSAKSFDMLKNDELKTTPFLLKSTIEHK